MPEQAIFQRSSGPRAMTGVGHSVTTPLACDTQHLAEASRSCVPPAASLCPHSCGHPSNGPRRRRMVSFWLRPYTTFLTPCARAHHSKITVGSPGLQDDDLCFCTHPRVLCSRPRIRKNRVSIDSLREICVNGIGRPRVV